MLDLVDKIRTYKVSLIYELIEFHKKIMNRRTNNHNFVHDIILIIPGVRSRNVFTGRCQLGGNRVTAFLLSR